LNTAAHVALAGLSDADLQGMILQLGRYALSVSSKLRWRTGNAAQLPRGETVDSIVSLALTKVLTGQRRWDPQQDPDIKTYLMNVIDSLLNHLATSKDNTMLTAMPDTASGGDTQAQASSSANPSVPAWHAQPPKNPETALLQKEEEHQKARALQFVHDASHDDPLVARMIRAMQDGYGKPGDIATVLGLPVTEVYKAMKRLDRKLVHVRQHMQQMQVG
jgi:DNA-directed RNA polymerase specialized sigma24 family protein